MMVSSSMAEKTCSILGQSPYNPVVSPAFGAIPGRLDIPARSKLQQDKVSKRKPPVAPFRALDHYGILW